MSEVVAEEQQQQRTTATILDEYCHYYSDFSKILSIYIKSFYPQFHFEFEQLLDASYNVWHHLNDEDKLSLATFLEEINRENNQDMLSSSSLKMNSKILVNKLKYPSCTNNRSIVLNTNSSIKSITPFHIYLKDERQKFLRKHANMPKRDINKRLSERWHKMSNRMKEKYVHRSYLAKKRLYKKQGKTIQLKKPSFIKRIS